MFEWCLWCLRLRPAQGLAKASILAGWRLVTNCFARRFGVVALALALALAILVVVVVVAAAAQPQAHQGRRLPKHCSGHPFQRDEIARADHEAGL